MILLTKASSHYCSVPANGMANNVSACCGSAWFILSAAPSSTPDAFRMLSLSTEARTDFSRFAFGIGTTNSVINVSARTVDTDPGAALNGTVSVPLSTLTHIAVNLDFVNNLFYTYINGIYSETIAGDWTPGNTNAGNSLAAALGASPAGLRFYSDCTLEDIRFYNRLLTAAEIGEIFYMRGRPCVLNGLSARWTLRGKQDGHVCTGAESMINEVNTSLNATPTAGIQYVGSPLVWNKQG